MARVCVGCGLKTNTDSELVVDTGAAVWPFTCASTQGGSLYCASDNRLTGPPDILVDTDELSFNANITPIVIGNGQTIPVGTTNIVSTAPGTCGQEVLRVAEIEFQVDVVIDVTAASSGDILTVRGFIGLDHMTELVLPVWSNEPFPAGIPYKLTQTTKTIPRIVTAGAAAGQFDFSVMVVGPATVTVNRLNWIYRIGYVTSHTP